jgi:hypothetical protein
MAQHIPVSFDGDGAGIAELTWGQQELWRTMRLVDGWMPVPVIRQASEGATVADVVAELRFIMSRYPSMRTRLRLADDLMPQQVLACRGVVDLEVEEVADGDDPAEAAAAMRRRFEDAAFDFVRDWPVRMGVVCRQGRPAYLVSVICHLALDGFAAMRIMTDLANRDPATGRAPTPPAGTQLLELARWQCSPAGRRQSDRALQHWERQLSTIEPGRPTGPVHRSSPPHQLVVLQSPATYLAARLIAERLREPVASVLLTLFAVVRARVSGVDPVVVLALSGNRFRPGLADVVSPVTQPALCVFNLARLTFADAVRQVRQRSTTAFMNAYYDPVRMVELIDRVGRARGEEFDLRCFYNDRLAFAEQGPPGPVPTPDAVRAARDNSALSWSPIVENLGDRLFLTVNTMPDGLALEMSAGNYLSRDDMHACVTGMESLAVEAAEDPTVATAV